MSEVQLKIGNKTEKDVVSILREHGYWVYRCAMKNNGQPVDIIAIKGGQKYHVWLIDGKHVTTNKVSFVFNRIEPNQITSLRYARDFAGIENTGFAIEFERTGEFYYLPFSKYEELAENGYKSVNLSELELFEEVLYAHDNL